MQRSVEQVLAALQQNEFRAKFKLTGTELSILQSKGLPTVMEHARQLLSQRLAPAKIANDGKQTPWRGHPVFIAQHATATCCRGCVSKWHGIPKGHSFTEEEFVHVLAVIEAWLRKFAQAQQDQQPPQSSIPMEQCAQLKLF